METLGSRVKYLRKCFSMNQSTFANQINISQAALSDIEKGKTNPSVDTLRKISEEFAVTTDWLIKGDDILNENYFSDYRFDGMLEYISEQMLIIRNNIHKNYGFPSSVINRIFLKYIIDLYLSYLSDEGKNIMEKLELLNPKEKNEILNVMNALVMNKLQRDTKSS